LSPRIFCFGAVVVDLIAHPVGRLPGAGDSVRSPSIEPAIGGCAANAATALARLEYPVHLCGAVGDDHLGHFLRAGLEREGVDLKHLSTHPGMSTGVTFVINVEGEDRRFISAMGANDAPWPETIDGESLVAAEVVSLHAFGLARRPDVADACRIFQAGRDAGALTVLDVIVIPGEDLLPQLKQLLPLVDGFFPNQDEAERLTGLKDPAEAAALLRKLGARWVVVTCGDRGLVWDSIEGRGSLDAMAVPSIDATGCGDAFSAGYIDAHLKGCDPLEKLVRGSVMGAAAATAAGAIDGLPSRAAFDALHSTWTPTSIIS